MVPSRCIVHDDLPMTVHAKANRVALAKLAVPARSEPDLATENLGPIEATIAGIWRSVLGHNDFDIDRGFFSAGGNSLLLVRVYALLPSSYRDMVSLVDLVRLPTIRAVSQELRMLLSDSPEPNIQGVDRERGGLERLRARRHSARARERRNVGKKT